MGIFSKSIGIKVLGLVGTVFLISQMVIVTFYAKRQTAEIYNQHTTHMESLTDSISNGIKTIMIAGHGDIAKSYALNQKKTASFIEFNIMRTNGLQAFLDNKTIDNVNLRSGENEFIPRDKESVRRLFAADDPNLKQALHAKKMLQYQVKSGESTHLISLIPIHNDKGCHRCHGSKQPVRGVIKITTSLDKILGSIDDTYKIAVRILLASMVGNLFIIYILIRLSIIRPLSQISAAMTSVAQGRLDQEIPVIGRDELSKMATNYNQMISKLLKSHTSLNQEQNKLTTIILSAEEGIIVSDQSGKVVLVNPSAERLLDKSQEQIIQDGFLNVIDDSTYVSSFLESGGKEMPRILVYNNRIIRFHAATIRSKNDMDLGSAILIRDVTEEKKLEEELRKMSFTDKLTALFNRRYMEEMLNKEFIRSKRYNQNLSILFFDVDHFKKFNDTYGHDMGDRVLEMIGAMVKKIFRDPDIPCRYGGEEFCIIMPNTGAPGACVAAEKLRHDISIMDVDGVQVTITIGVATLPDANSATSEEFLKVADVALYKGKKTGRNRVVRWDQIED